MDNEPCVLHLLPFPIKHLIWRDTEIRIGMKLISCLHFPVPDDKSMQGFSQLVDSDLPLILMLFATFSIPSFLLRNSWWRRDTAAHLASAS